MQQDTDNFFTDLLDVICEVFSSESSYKSLTEKYIYKFCTKYTIFYYLLFVFG